MIVFDLQAVQSAAHGERGIARYVRDLAETLAALHPDVVDIFAWNDNLPYVDRLAELELGGRLRPFSELRNLEVDVLHADERLHARRRRTSALLKGRQRIMARSAHAKLERTVRRTLDGAALAFDGDV